MKPTLKCLLLFLLLNSAFLIHNCFSQGSPHFTTYGTEQGLALSSVRCSFADKSGNLWFGTYGGGVSRYDGKSFSNFTIKDGLANNTVLSITEDKSGNLWFGTNGGGVSRYDGKSFSNFTIKDGLANNTVRSITEDKSGNLWFGTDGGGVSRYDGTRANHPCNLNKCKHDLRTQKGLKEHQQELAKSFSNFTVKDGLANNTVWSITEDKSGNLWFGTNGGGVSRYDGKSFSNFTAAQGLADDVVLNVKQDQQGTIWTISNLGFSAVGFLYSKVDEKNDKARTEQSRSVKFPPSAFKFFEGEAFASVNSLINEELKKCKPVFRNFNNNTGYPVKDGINNSMLIDSKGIIWAGCSEDKLVRFDPKALNINPNPLELHIQSVRVNSENICWYSLTPGPSPKERGGDSLALLWEMQSTLGKQITVQELDSMRRRFSDIKFDGITKFYPLPTNLELPYRHNNVSFEFVAIEPAMQAYVKYKYKLEGYDEDWSPMTNKTSANFGNIHEGTYIFKLKCLSPFGVWSETSYTFKVLPPWFRTWWMYTVYFLLLVCFIWFLIWYNGRKLKARATELETKVHIATQEITTQKHHIEEKHKEITDSINYAERIQRSFLATKELLDENLGEYFVLFKPKDVVSGDFYWAGKLKNNKFALVTADSTGHGVPGAIMSLLNITSLEKAIETLSEPAEILSHTRKTIIDRLKKDGSEYGGKDGMDCSLISFDFSKKQLNIACANNPVWIVKKNGEVVEVKPDKMPVGKHDRDNESFTSKMVDIETGDVVYGLTDGFPDQFGGEKGKKFMSKNLRDLLANNAQLPMPQQKELLEKTFSNWIGNLEQVDDVTVVGVRV
ncbi:MAG: two-component regulator propeller domain-containing protein [Bacteroidia bacterium]